MSLLFLSTALYLNTYVMGLRSLKIVQLFQCGDRLYTSAYMLRMSIVPLKVFCIVGLLIYDQSSRSFQLGLQEQNRTENEMK